ncbi:MAG TPA: site-specific integrase [Desulfovibrio sp.]|uniref:site-specific integrase n=1 Tax=Desulfovibrio sp. TaxID=885 RepID=UPI002CAC231B|nr:site-specific integrase [Desulfovibrio sp.]HMM38198.1 site-specific integrase [Desulfovibrio sp.]
MPRCPGVQPRPESRNYRLRVKVPTDLLHHYHPRKEITKSLKTSDYRTACDRARVERVKLDQEFAEVRRKLAAQAHPRTSLTPTEVDRLAALWLHRTLADDDAQRLQGFDPDRAAEVLAFTGEDLQAALAAGDLRPVRQWVDDLLEEHGLALPPDGETYKRLCLAILKAEVRGHQLMADRLRGMVVDTPPAPAPLPGPAPVQTTAEGELTLSGLFEKWKDENAQRVTPKSLQEFTATVRRFTELHGDLPLSRITKALVRDFKDALLKCPAASHLPIKHRGKSIQELITLAEKDRTLSRLSTRTVNDKWLGFLCAVLSWGTANGYLENNPASNVKATVSKVQDKARVPYSIEDVNFILRFPIFTKRERPRAGGGEAAKWLPLLALFTGARLGELGKLQVEDVRHERDVWYLDLMNTGTKTQGSKRQVPIHPELIRLGFLEYVEARRKAGGDTLFPGRAGKSLDTEAWSKWWGRYARSHGIEDRRKVFHSFRHTVKDGLRDSGVPFDLRSALQGHAVPGVGEGYGQGFALQVLAEAMARLQYPGLDLEHLSIKP